MERINDAVTSTTQLRHSLTSSQTSRDINVTAAVAGGERLTTVHGVLGNGSHDDVETPRSDRSAKYADDSVAVVTAVCVCVTLLIVLITIAAAILVRRRRANKLGRYTRSCYVSTCQFDDPVWPVNAAADDMTFVNHLQQFVFEVNGSHDCEWLVNGPKRSPSLSAHEDALRVATTPPLHYSSSSHDSLDQGQRSNDNETKYPTLDIVENGDHATMSNGYVRRSDPPWSTSSSSCEHLPTGSVEPRDSRCDEDRKSRGTTPHNDDVSPVKLTEVDCSYKRTDLDVDGVFQDDGDSITVTRL